MALQLPALVLGCVELLSVELTPRRTDLVQCVCQCVDGCRQWLSLGVKLSCLVGSGDAVCEVGQWLQHVAQQLGITQGHSHAATCQWVPTFTPCFFFIMIFSPSISLFTVFILLCSVLLLTFVSTMQATVIPDLL